MSKEKNIIDKLDDMTDDMAKKGSGGSLFLFPEEAADLRALVRELKAEREERKKGSADGWTREKIMAVKNMTERQKLINEHIDLFR